MRGKDLEPRERGEERVNVDREREREGEGERERACYGRDGPFGRRTSGQVDRAERGKREKLLELGIFTKPCGLDKRHTSLDIRFFFRRHALKSNRPRSKTRPAG